MAVAKAPPTAGGNKCRRHSAAPCPLRGVRAAQCNAMQSSRLDSSCSAEQGGGGKTLAVLAMCPDSACGCRRDGHRPSSRSGMTDLHRCVPLSPELEDYRAICTRGCSPVGAPASFAGRVAHACVRIVERGVGRRVLAACLLSVPGPTQADAGGAMWCMCTCVFRLGWPQGPLLHRLPHRALITTDGFALVRAIELRGNQQPVCMPPYLHMDCPACFSPLFSILHGRAGASPLCIRHACSVSRLFFCVCKVFCEPMTLAAGVAHVAERDTYHATYEEVWNGIG